MLSLAEVQLLLAGYADRLPPYTQTTLLVLAVPSVLVLLHRRFLRIPPSERGVPFLWIEPVEAKCVHSFQRTMHS